VQSPSPRFTFMYTLHASSRKPRTSYLRALLSMLAVEQHESLEDESLTEELRLCEWLGHVLAEMPYDKEADVLGVVHNANRMLSLSAEPTLAAAAKLLGDDDFQDTPKPPAEITAAVSAADGTGDQARLIKRACHMCAVVAITLKLKQHLKRVYALSDLRCQGFDPIDAAKAPERPIMRMAESLDKQSFSPLTSQGDADAVTTCATQYLWLRSLMADDEAEFDFNLLTATPKPPAPPGSASKSRKRPSSGGGGASSGRGRGRPPSNGNGSGGRTSGGRGSGGRGGKGAKPKAKKRKKSDDSSEEEDDGDEDDEDFEA